MNSKTLLHVTATIIVAVMLAAMPAMAQMLEGAPADPQYKYSTPMPPGVAIPDQVETRLGTLRFDSGVPDQATTDKLYDNLDFQRAVQAYLLGLPPVNQLSNKSAILSMGPANQTVPIWEQLVDSRTVELTANDNTPYSWFWVDLRNGPLVLEVPPKVLGLIDDMWYHYVINLGFTGPDKGRGGKYLLLPPGYGRGAARLPRRAMCDLQRLARLAQLPRRWRSQAGCGAGQEVHQDLPALAGGQEAAEA